MEAGRDLPSDFERTFWRSSADLPVESEALTADQVDGSEFRLLADNIPTLAARVRDLLDK